MLPRLDDLAYNAELIRAFRGDTTLRDDLDELVRASELALPEEVRAWHLLSYVCLQSGDAERARGAAGEGLAAARAARLPGWEAAALALRASAWIELRNTFAAVDDLIDAEVALAAASSIAALERPEPGEDAGRTYAVLRAHQSISSAYLELDLYELAQTHLEQALELEIAPEYGRRVGDRANLALLHKSWALDLDRVGLDDEGARRAYRSHLRRAERWLREAADRAGPDYPLRFFLEREQLGLRAALDPAGSLDELARRCAQPLISDDPDDVVVLKIAHTRALREVGRLTRAVSVATETVEQSTSTTEVRRATVLDAYFELHRAQLAAGVEGSLAVAGFIQTLAQERWDRREDSVTGVQARRELALLRDRHAETSRLAHSDPLTGLANRRALDRWLHEHRHGPATLVLIDLDNFKRTNDSYGHTVGDVVLTRVADSLRALVDADGLAVRFGGDEFVVVAAGPDIAELPATVTAAVRAISVEDLAPLAGVRASIGVATAAESEPTKGLLTWADDAMFRAKRGVAADRSITAVSENPVDTGPRGSAG